MWATQVDASAPHSGQSRTQHDNLGLERDLVSTLTRYNPSGGDTGPQRAGPCRQCIGDVARRPLAFAHQFERSGKGPDLVMQEGARRRFDVDFIGTAADVQPVQGLDRDRA